MPVNIINIPPTKIAIASAAGTTVIQSIDSINVATSLSVSWGDALTLPLIW